MKNFVETKKIVFNEKFNVHTKMSIMIDKKWRAIDDFEMMISNDEICYKKLTTSIILKIKTENSQILFYNVINIFDLIIDLKMINDEKFDFDV